MPSLHRRETPVSLHISNRRAMHNRSRQSPEKAEQAAIIQQVEIDYRVRITKRSHPHYGEVGKFTGKLIRMPWGSKPTMAEVKLEDCRHGVDGCFVSKGDVAKVVE